jgi:hypothetical protein
MIPRMVEKEYYFGEKDAPKNRGLVLGTLNIAIKKTISPT